jgi:hypothetical protein
MPGVICGECNHETAVRFRRGTRLADIRCPSCGQPALKMSTAGRANPNAGRTYERCAKCNKRGLHHKHPPFGWVPKYAAADDGPYPARSPCCWFHESVPAARTSYDHVTRALDARLGPASANLWATAGAAAELEACAPPVPAACPICTAAGLPERGFHTQAHAYQRGTALLAICDGCCHTIELTTLASSAATAEGGQEAAGAP